MGIEGDTWSEQSEKLLLSVTAAKTTEIQGTFSSLPEIIQFGGMMYF